jgi:hypothetical protein
METEACVYKEKCRASAESKIRFYQKSAEEIDLCREIILSLRVSLSDLDPH